MTGELDAAWAKAEAALATAGVAGSILTFFSPVELRNGSFTDWTVRSEKQIRWGGRGKTRYARTYADGPTPAAALRALAARLRETS